MTDIKLISNPFRDDKYTARLSSDDCIKFHKSLPDYSSSPLVDLYELSENLNLKSLQIKDESKRFNLNAFKSLGASYAMAKIIVSQVGNDQLDLDFNSIMQHKNAVSYTHLTLPTKA